jgi:hypothetical protein
MFDSLALITQFLVGQGQVVAGIGYRFGLRELGQNPLEPVQGGKVRRLPEILSSDIDFISREMVPAFRDLPSRLILIRGAGKFLQ